ncbi:MAG: peptide chain release factor N(5)-glutamine methyltransferase [Patescibacteria group bacterium]
MSQEIEWLLEEKYKGEKSEAFFADCRLLALGEPLGYLIGHVPFLGCTISLDSKPLIPRPETEFWVEKAIVEIKRGGEAAAPRILDLCAGSGCIGVAVAKHLPNCHVDFSEIDASHLPTIKKNLSENGIDLARTNVAHTNLFEVFSGTYHFILSNPPYIDMDLKRTDNNVLEHEPYIALSGGLAGLEVIQAIIEEAPKHLEHHGQLWLEHEPEQSLAIRNLAREHKFTCTTHTDQYDVERYSVLVLQ